MEFKVGIIFRLSKKGMDPMVYFLSRVKIMVLRNNQDQWPIFGNNCQKTFNFFLVCYYIFKREIALEVFILLID